MFLFAQTVTNIEMFPELDISIFAPYKIKAQVSGSPTSVTTQIQLLNADGTTNWDYYANGTPHPGTIQKTMTYDLGEDKYISEDIYPDSIYPEIFFVPSDVTRNNLALETGIYRSNYHLFHFDNPLTITDQSSFFVEFNAKPRSATSSTDLSVYLVKKNKPVTFFNSSWMNSPDVELIGTFNRNGTFNHTHSEENNSQHNLIYLTSNGDGTLGLKNIDVNGDFWIVLYSDTTNVNQGWDLRYQPESFCSDITNRWYKGNKLSIVQGGRVRETFSTSLSSGCPDVHVHIARRGLDFYDSIFPVVTATYADNSSTTATSSIPFADLPNLAPNPTSFVTPIAEDVYDGNELLISWNPIADPNNDTVNYTIYVNDGSATTTLIASTTDTTFNWNIASIADGTYNISGKVCDDDPMPLCTSFNLSSPFVVKKAIIVENTSRSSGTTIDGMVKNLLGMGNEEGAKALINTYNNLFSNNKTINNEVDNWNFTQRLEIGMGGDDVKRLQIFLNDNGFKISDSGPGSPGKETNIFGALTKKALIKFQKAYKIDPALGSFGSSTIEFINSGVLRSIPTTTSTTTSTTTPAMVTFKFKFGIGKGSISDSVSELQKILAKYNDIYPEGKITGYFGELTKNAVKKFQIKFKLVNKESDPGYGYVGPATREKLNELMTVE